jgi:hypothetical protein
MIGKLVIQISLIPFLLAMGCGTGQQGSLKGEKMTQIILNGNELSPDKTTSDNFIREIDQLFMGCDDYYELIVSDQVIESIKGEKQYLEIVFPGQRSLETEKFRKIEFDRMLIPLSGTYHSSGQVTFFTGTKTYSNTPLLNSKGSVLLDEALKKITN